MKYFKFNRKLVCLIIPIVILLILIVLLMSFSKNSYPKFNKTTDGYDFQRLVVNKNKISYLQAGKFIVKNGQLIPDVTNPAFPYEKSKKAEPKVWGKYVDVINTIIFKKQIPQGVLEYFGNYYLISSNNNKLIVYSLSPTSNNGVMEFEDFIKAINRNSAQNSTASGGNGLLF